MKKAGEIKKYFNPTLGLLEPSISLSSFVFFFSFQSHSGTIGTKLEPHAHILYHKNFNPTLGLLELCGRRALSRSDTLFQSHSGTIGTNMEFSG